MRVNAKSAPMPRNELMKRLHAEGVATRPGTHAVHMLSYYARTFGFLPDDLPSSRDCQENTIAIPLHNRMDVGDCAYVIEKLKRIAAHG
jgi:dTDP-4-amino-4,6-dideoxygalactose transaminase